MQTIAASRLSVIPHGFLQSALPAHQPHAIAYPNPLISSLPVKDNSMRARLW